MATSRSIKDIAHALISVAAEGKVVPEVLRDLKLVDAIFRVDKHLAVDLSENSVALEKRQHTIQKTFDKKIHLYAVNALLALQKRELLEDFGLMRTAAVKEAEDLAEHREAVVRTPVPLSEKEKAALEKKLVERFGGTVALEEQLDPSLIGGLTITIGDWVIDDSVTGKLDRLTQAFYV